MMSLNTTLYSTQEAATVAGIGETTVKRYCKKGIVGDKVGRFWVLTGDDIGWLIGGKAGCRNCED